VNNSNITDPFDENVVGGVSPEVDRVLIGSDLVLRVEVTLCQSASS